MAAPMFEPNHRSLYTSILSPPQGTVLTRAVATTYSLDPLTLLAVPVHLAFVSDRSGEPWTDGIAALDAIRRVSNRITVFSQRGLMQVPGRSHVLFGLLEKLVVEVTAPHNNGMFHPKLWLLRFDNPEHQNTPVIRLAILTRNLTRDRCWDLAFQLDGPLGDVPQPVNEPVARFVEALPSLAFNPVHADRLEAVRAMADDVRHTEWAMPPDCESLRFHVLGLHNRGWHPGQIDRLAVISPFCSPTKVNSLFSESKSKGVLLSRPEELDEKFGRLTGGVDYYVLDEGAEAEDADLEEVHQQRDDIGLHAKAYIFERGPDTHVVVGSANATVAGLGGANVELLVELVGKRAKVGGINQLLSSEGLGQVITRHFETESPVESPDAAAAKHLERVRDRIARADLHLDCRPDEQDGYWRLLLRTDDPLDLTDVTGVAWPISVSDETAANLSQLGEQGGVDLGRFSAGAVTGLIGFEIRIEDLDVRLRFALNLPVSGMPAERDRAILRTVIRNRDGFLRYLLLLLGDQHLEPEAAVLAAESGNGKWRTQGYDSIPLLEEMTRAFCRDRERLNEVRQVLEHLQRDSEEDDIIPAEFVQLWHVFQAAIEYGDA